MSKVKTKKGAKKRFSITSTGKVMRKHGYSSHLKDKKNSSRLRRHAEPELVQGEQRNKIKKLLGK